MIFKIWRKNAPTTHRENVVYSVNTTVIFQCEPIGTYIKKTVHRIKNGFGKYLKLKSLMFKCTYL